MADVPAPIPDSYTLDYELDIFGQQPGINIYTQITLCYAVPDPIASAHSTTTITDVLSKGLERLSARFPWVAGKIVNEGKSEGNTGVYKIRSFLQSPRLVVKDLRDDPSMPSFDDLREARFPSRMLDESVVAPRMTLPTPEEVTQDWPVFAVQATFVRGGLLLTFVGHHGAMDMTGQGFLIDLLAKACRGEEFTSEEVAIGNVDRRTIIPFLDDSWAPEPDKAKPAPAPSPSDSADAQPPKSSWVYFLFSPTSLASLKSLATQSLSSGFVSTDDTLSAFIWQSVSRARLPRLDPSHPTTFARAIDPRRFIRIPLNYPGLVQNMTFTTSALQELIDTPLGSVAATLRSAVDPRTSDVEYRTRAMATRLRRAPDKGVVPSVTASLDLGSDIMLSSWAGQDFYELDFGMGVGRPEAVRRPRFVPVESLMYLMPKRGDGEVAAFLCLRDEDIERLRRDEEFVKYGVYVG
ncbi:hypothetical protein CVT26_013458 [Gymnopilus dilepis]|uniref:Trichothecene 3-O-acetyltransferase-like N-terminal domain-containing protein n=1 Tax=Gymnopilus dilepis TaxID=231916 RepID=A0A409YWX2_9AGAR|nr:hypothetical protein CVT26_013458 [Gymnopilus dilepis]